MPDLVLTEEGRVFDLSSMREGKGLLELKDGAWVSVPCTWGLLPELHDGRPLKAEDLRSYGFKSGISN